MYSPKYSVKEYTIVGMLSFFAALGAMIVFYVAQPYAWPEPDKKDEIKTAMMEMMNVGPTDFEDARAEYEAAKTKMMKAPPAPKTEEEITTEDEIENIYVLLQGMNARAYTTMDTMIRIFHYTKPHKGPTRGCPECAEIHDRTNNVDTVTISRDQWEKFKKLEATAK